MSRVIIPGRLANKANQYRVHIDPTLWARIKDAVQQWRTRASNAPWWVAPSGEVEAYESEVAYRFLQQERREWKNGELLQLTIRLVAQRSDCDAVKAILDGIQKSARIKNDRQFRKILIEHVEGKQPAVEIEVELL